MNFELERFGDRVRWAIDNLTPDQDLLATDRDWIGFIAEPNDLHRAMARVVGPDAAMTQKTWLRALNNGSVPAAYIVWMLRVFPELTAAALKAPSYATFETTVKPLTEAKARWTKIVQYVAKKRDDLASIGKRYHRNVDAAQRENFAVPGFPLIVKDGWVLDHPLQLLELDDPDLPKLRFSPPVDTKPLDGLNVDLMTFKGQLLDRKNPSTRKRPRYNGDCYRVLDIVPTSSGLNIQFGQGKYFDYVNSCEILGAELAEWRIDHPNEDTPRALRRRGSPDALFDFRNRVASAGVSCITLIKDYPKSGGRGEGNYFLVHERGEATLEAQNTVHVIPAGSHEPLKTGFGDDREIQIWRTAVREFIEELFSKEELAQQKREPDDFLDRASVRPIVNAFFRGARNKPPCAKLFLLGVGLDPVTTKPEILVAIVANWRRALASDIGEIKFNWEGKGDWVGLSTDSLLREAAGYLRANAARSDLPTLPAGAACMQLAARHLNFLMGEAP